MLSELLKIKEEIDEAGRLFYIVEPAMPEKLDFNGEMKPGFILLPPKTTGLDQDLLVIPPSLEKNVLDSIGYMLRPVTREDWDKAIQRKLQEGLFVPCPEMKTPIIITNYRSEM